MSSETSISELKRDLSTIINRAAYGKERIVLTRRGRDLVAVIPLEDLKELEVLDESKKSTLIEGPGGEMLFR